MKIKDLGLFLWQFHQTKSMTFPTPLGDFCTGFQNRNQSLFPMCFRPQFTPLSLTALVALSALLTACSPETYVDPVSAPSNQANAANPQPMMLESIGLLAYPDNLEGISWAMELPTGEVIDGFYALSPNGDPVLFDGFDPVVLSTPTAVHSVWIRERFEANHEVTYQTINRFDFVPADALNQILFLGKPGKTAIRLNIAEVN